MVHLAARDSRLVLQPASPARTKPRSQPGGQTPKVLAQDYTAGSHPGDTATTPQQRMDRNGSIWAEGLHRQAGLPAPAAHLRSAKARERARCSSRHAREMARMEPSSPSILLAFICLFGGFVLVCLFVFYLVRVPVAVKDNHSIGRLEVQTQPTSPSAEQKNEVLGAWLIESL